MTRITLRQLEYFRAIAVTGSLSAAAEDRHVSRSTIASALDDLERGLGAQLCVRYKSLVAIARPRARRLNAKARELIRIAIEEIDHISPQSLDAVETDPAPGRVD
ncbi:MAG: LysR family transcriptional regulator [Actinomycetales bacterium]|nr:LysR family transcriptional regulator [Actinomycetales bacterium]